MFAALRQRNFALLWVGGLVSSIGDLVLFVALPFYVYALTGSTLATGGMFLAETLPRLLLGSLAGVFVDRWDRRRTMLAADLIRAALLLPLLAVHSRDTLWLVYVAAATGSAVSQFFMPARSALLPRLVSDAQLMAANGLTSLGDALTQLIGPSVGGALFALLGLPGVIAVDVASFLFSALMLACLVIPPADAAPVKALAPVAAGAWLASFVGGWLDGLRLMARDRLLATLLAILGLFDIGQGIINVVVVVFVRDVLHGSAQTFGWLITAQGVGGIIGGLLIGQVGRRVAPAHLILIGGVTAGATLIVMVNAASLPLALALIVPLGVTVVGYVVATSTLLQRAVADAYRGRVFGALGATNAFLMLMGIALASALGDRLGSVLLLSGAGVLYLSAGLLGLSLLRLPAGRAIAVETA